MYYLQGTTLSPVEKNVVYFYCFPRPLADYGLPPRIQEYRATHGIGDRGDSSEVIFLAEACQTEQYGRFMKHLMHAFGNPENVHPISGTDTDTCCICGKSTVEYDEYLAKGLNSPEVLSYGSSDSSSTICIDCLSRLIETMELVENLDPSFLNWAKRYQSGLSAIKPI